ncbi:MAG TPA: sugar phosphate isomerase/epimerase family protein [Armatimonadota bacterium]|nr:sugar phosphate isomerase/epimerase family protein [Armatimonadota bacterium]
MAHLSPVQQGTLQVGLFADNLKLPLREGISTAAKFGADSFQMYTTRGEVLPENMSKEQRAAFRAFYEGTGMQLSAICADFGLGFVDPAKNEHLIPRMLEQVDLAVDLGTSIITTHIGHVPEERNEVWETIRVALNTIGAYAEKKGIVLATETGPESGPVLRALLETLDNNATRVNFDPANLVMSGFDLDEAINALAPFIVHTHAKDGYKGPNGKGEAPLGSGDVPWKHYIARLREVGYAGAFTIEREAGDDPIGDMRASIAFLRQF